MAEALFVAEPQAANPELSLDRRWAETILERAASQLQIEFAHANRADLFRALNRFMSLPAGPGEYEAIGATLGMSAAAIAKSGERLRRRYRELVRQEIAQTVRSPEEVDDEMPHLLDILSRT